MRIVHTSDWHAGKIWRRLDRTDELDQVLDHLARFIESERVDLLLISGDLFDTPTPPAHAERLVFAFFRRVGKQCPIVVIAGNHDGARRFEAWGTLARSVRVHVVPHLLPPDRGGVLEIETPGGERAQVAALPFVRPGELIAARQLTESQGQAYQSYADRLGRVIQLLCQGFRGDAVNLFIGHLFVDGAVISGSERRLHIGDTWAVPPQALPQAAHYLALGHIHKPQAVEGMPKACYAGSPLQLDFGEAEEAKSFVFIEARPGRPAHIERIPYEGGKPLLDLKMDWETFLQEAKQGLRNQELGRRGWIRLTLPLDRPEPDIAQKVRRLCPNVVAVRIELPWVPPKPQSPPAKELSPLERYRLYYQKRHGRMPPSDLLEAFEKLYQEALAQ